MEKEILHGKWDFGIEREIRKEDKSKYSKLCSDTWEKAAGPRQYSENRQGEKEQDEDVEKKTRVDQKNELH